MHDPRLDDGYGLSYQCEPTPGRHTIASNLSCRTLPDKKKFPQAKRLIGGARSKIEKRARAYAASSIYTQVMNGSGMCSLRRNDIEPAHRGVAECRNGLGHERR